MAYILATEATILELAEKRQNRILNDNYEGIDLDATVNSIGSLSEHQKKQLIKTLKFPTLFSGGLGIIDIKPIHLEIKDGASQNIPRSTQSPKLLKSSPSKSVWNYVKFESLEKKTTHSG